MCHNVQKPDFLTVCEKDRGICIFSKNPLFYLPKPKFYLVGTPKNPVFTPFCKFYPKVVKTPKPSFSGLWGDGGVSKQYLFVQTFAFGFWFCIVGVPKKIMVPGQYSGAKSLI